MKTALKGNYVSEWFGQRIHPQVRLNVAAVTGQGATMCPFLTDVLHEPTKCVKNENSCGVCSISSSSNGPRQDWLVCPLRVISSNIVNSSCRLIFGLGEDVSPVPVSVLQTAGELETFKGSVLARGAGYLFFQNKLGGEISVDGTAQSPELSFDVTLVEIVPTPDGHFTASRYGILEIQTMDFHGSYKSAVRNLNSALHLHKKNFPETLQDHPQWAGEGVEGPNIANVFKRTFYQMMLKFKLSGEGAASAGTVLAIPRSVWDSWQPFLGAPELEDETLEIKRFKLASGGAEETPLNAFICVFDLDSSALTSISPVKLESFIRVSPERLAHHAFTRVPERILHSIRTQDSVLSRIRNRLNSWWPDFQEKPASEKRAVKRPPARRPSKT